MEPIIPDHTRRTIFAGRAAERAVEKLTGHSVNMLMALEVVGGFPGCSIGYVADELGFAKSTMTNLVATAVTAGWLERTEIPENRKLHSLQLTVEGVNMLNRATAALR